MKKKILITGCAGFIGFHLSNKLINEKKYEVFGLDNINNYYDINLKKKRLSILTKSNKFKFYKLDLKNFKKLQNLFKKNNFDYVINLAAQAGVRYSITNPDTYFDSNILGFYNILKLCKDYEIKHLIFASTSSVYGDAKKFPLSEQDNTDRPKSFYSASKKINEVMAYSFSSLHNLKITGLRFFTVYGTFGRPDMALFKFSNAIMNNHKFELFNDGNHFRDFTHVNDVTNSIFKLIKTNNKDEVPFKILNICRASTVNLKYVVKLIEKFYDKIALYKSLPMQKGDVHKTLGSNANLFKITKMKPSVKFEDGLKEFLNWHQNYEKN